MDPRPRLARAAIAAAAIALACGDAGPDAGPAPRPLGEARDLAPEAAASPEAQALTIAGNPRLLLFDLQTALEGVKETRGTYPSVDEFQATGSWELQRAALDAAFDVWTYESDGKSYSLAGEASGRSFGIRSP